MLYCNRCDGRVLLDRSVCKDGDVELYCLRCGNRWEAHRSTFAAQYFTKSELRRSAGLAGYYSKPVLSEQAVA